jgi:hypothetical protein
MWSLPDVVKMNAEAADKNRQKKLERACVTHRLDRQRVQCDHCNRPATLVRLWYDIFSDDPKGIIASCEDHEDRIEEGNFFCGDCERTFVENYTWELYYHTMEDGEQLCLNCWAKRYLKEEGHWLDLDAERIEKVDFNEIRKAPHLIAVSGNIPEGLERVGGVTLDSSSGGEVTGFSYSESSPDSGVEKIREVLREAQEQGKKKAVLILDAAWQFCVEVGVYVKTEEGGEEGARGSLKDESQARGVVGNGGRGRKKAVAGRKRAAA